MYLLHSYVTGSLNPSVSLKVKIKGGYAGYTELASYLGCMNTDSACSNVRLKASNYRIGISAM